MAKDIHIITPPQRVNPIQRKALNKMADKADKTYADSWPGKALNAPQNNPPRSDVPSVIHTRSQIRTMANSNFAKDANPPPTKSDLSTWPKQNIQSFKKGGTVKKTGLALVHKGEKVIPRMADRMNKLISGK